MCSETNCSHVKYDPNKPASLSTEDQASIWADIKETQKALNARQSFLECLGKDLAATMADSKYIELSGLLTGLWTRFRVL